MKIYFANMFSVKGLENYLRYKIDILGAYPSFKKSNVEKPPYCNNLFVDSGAFGKNGSNINIHSYIDFLQSNKDNIDVYANLDAIGDPEKSYKNLLKIERHGLNPIPVFHFGSDIKWLRKMISKYDYIALGGLVPVAADRNAIRKWLDRIWNYIYQSDPEIKVHGFGVQSFDLMKRYPWYSVDATSVHVIARYGGIYTSLFSGDLETIKINPKVNSREKEWQDMRPKVVEKKKEFVNKYCDFSYEDACRQDNVGVLIRCAVSIHYLLDELKDYKCNYKTKNKTLF